MPRLLNRSLSIKSVIHRAFGLDNELEGGLIAVSDSNVGGIGSITSYIKGRMPLAGTTLLTKEPIAGYECILREDPAVDFTRLIGWLSVNVGFQNLTSGITGVNVSIGQNVIIEDDVAIGDGSIIGHNVVICSGTNIGKNCIINSGASIGGQGFGFNLDKHGQHNRQIFIGGVILEDEVEVGHNCTVAAGSIDPTILRSGVKLDNLVHVAHDCILGEKTLVAAGAAFSGYVVTGKSVRFAPNSTVRQRVTIGDNALVGMGASVLRDVKSDSIVFGNPGKLLKS